MCNSFEKSLSKIHEWFVNFMWKFSWKKSLQTIILHTFILRFLLLFFLNQKANKSISVEHMDKSHTFFQNIPMHFI